MRITQKWAKENSACGHGRRWLEEHFPDGGEYQDVLDALAAEDNASWAQWLIQKAGPTQDVLEVEGNIEIECSLFFAGRIKATGHIRAKRVVAGWGIEAGTGIKAGTGIEAGEDWGIYAGLRLRISQKAQYALVIAKEMPKNLLLGLFQTKEKNDDLAVK